MHGILGGYLLLVEAVGACVMYVLIGKKAGAAGRPAQVFRLAAGAIVGGFVIGFFVGWILLDHAWIGVALGLIGSVVSSAFSALPYKISVTIGDDE